MVTDIQVITDGYNQKKKKKKTRNFSQKHIWDLSNWPGNGKWTTDNGHRTVGKFIYVYVRLRKNKAKIHLIIAGQT